MTNPPLYAGAPTAKEGPADASSSSVASCPADELEKAKRTAVAADTPDAAKTVTFAAPYPAPAPAPADQAPAATTPISAKTTAVAADTSAQAASAKTTAVAAMGEVENEDQLFDPMPRRPPCAQCDAGLTNTVHCWVKPKSKTLHINFAAVSYATEELWFEDLDSRIRNLPFAGGTKDALQCVPLVHSVSPCSFQGCPRDANVACEVCNLPRCSPHARRCFEGCDWIFCHPCYYAHSCVRRPPSPDSDKISLAANRICLEMWCNFDQVPQWQASDRKSTIHGIAKSTVRRKNAKATRRARLQSLRLRRRLRRQSMSRNAQSQTS